MKTMIVVPTYNEADNIERLIAEIFRHCPNVAVLVVDDHSPDKTWEIVEKIAKNDHRVHLLLRTEDRGRGKAGIAGFQYALKYGADVIIEMDADFSHDPRYLPIFLDEIEDYDVVVGSRFVQGGQDVDRGWWRRIITVLANIYIRLFLGFQLQDCSSGYRAFRREVVENLGLDSMISVGPSIVQEMLFRACQMKYRVIEIPIVFVDRKEGNTKLTYGHLLRGFAMVLKLRFSSKLKHFKNKRAG